jgi:outer membrane protein
MRPTSSLVVAALVGAATAVVLTLVFAARPVTAAAPPIKIGYIDLQKTLQSTKVGKAAVAKLEREKTAKQTQVNKKKEELKAAAAQLEKQRVVLKPEAVAQKERALEQQYVELQQTFVQLQQDLSRKEAMLTRELYVSAQQYILDIAKRDGYLMILEKNESAVLYGDPSLDITAEVNRRLDAAKPARKPAPRKPAPGVKK